MTDRVVTFSIKPEDREAWEEVQKLKAYAKSKGISFSYFMIKGVNKVNKELKLK